MKRRFRWWLSAVLLYLVSAPIIFIFIGLSLYLIAFIWGVINNLSGNNTASHWAFVHYVLGIPYFLCYIGIPSSLLFSFFIPPLVLGWLRKRRLRILMQVRKAFAKESL